MLRITANREEKCFKRIKERVPNIDIDFSLELNKGEKILLIGSNGSGKSSLLSAIAMALQYSNQTVNNYWAINCINIASKSPVFYFDFELFDPKTFYRTSSERQIFEKHYRLGSHREVVDDELKQRLKTFRAGLGDSAVILFDEPEDGMDYRSQKKMSTWVNDRIGETDMGIIATNCYYLVYGDLPRLDLDKFPIRKSYTDRRVRIYTPRKNKIK